MSVEAIVQAAAAGQVKDWSALKREWAPLLAPTATVTALKRSAGCAKTCVTIAQSGAKAISSTSTLEQEELVFTALTILDRLGKAGLLRTTPLEVEKVWFNFARKVCAAGHCARALVYVRHLLALLGARGEQENAAGAPEAYLPQPGDSEARVHLSACAAACHCTALAEADPKAVLGGTAWTQALAWTERVADPAKCEALQLELGRVLAVAVRNAAKSLGSAAVAKLSVVQGSVWCRLFLVCDCSKLGLTQLRECLPGAEKAETGGPLDEAVVVACAKKMEDFRKWCVAGAAGGELRESAATVLIEYAGLVASVVRKCPRLDKLEPFGMEAVGTAAVIMAELGGAEKAEATLRDFEGRFERYPFGLAAKHYNVGVVLYAASKFDSACGAFASCCRLLQAQHCVTKQFADHFAERHLATAQCLENCGRLHEGLSYAVWALNSSSSSTGSATAAAATAAVVRLWQSCEASATVTEEARKSVSGIATSQLRWALLETCNAWRPMANTSQLSECLLGLETGHPREPVERARLEMARGELDKARKLLAGVGEGSVARGAALFWSAVLEVDYGTDTSQAMSLLCNAAAWLTENLSCDSARWMEGLVDIFEWLERPSAALSLARHLAKAFPEQHNYQLLLTRLEGRRPCKELASSAMGEWLNVQIAEAQLAAALDPFGSAALEAAQSGNVWVRSRAEHVLAVAHERRGEREAALQRSVGAVRQALAAAKGGCDSISPWLQRRFALEACVLCAALHEARGMVLEAEFLCGRAADMCAAQDNSRLVSLRSFLCTTACRRRDLKEAKSVLSKMRGQAKALQSEPDHKLALSRYKEASGDFHAAKWEESKSEAVAAEAYTRYKQAVALCEGQRARLLKVKQGAAMARIGRTADAIGLWKDIACDAETDAATRSLAQYHLGIAELISDPVAAATALTAALESGRLDSVLHARAATEMALLAEGPERQFEWHCQAIGITFSHQQALLQRTDARAALPHLWTVVAVSLVERESGEVGLLVSRLGGNTVSVRLLTGGAGSIRGICNRLNGIIARSDETTRRQVASSQDKKLWWHDRMGLDKETKDLLNEIETNWFGSERDVLRPKVPHSEATEASALAALKQAAQKAGIKRRSIGWNKIDQGSLLRVFGTVPFYRRTDLADALWRCCRGVFDEAECKKIAPWLAKEASCVGEDAPGCPMVLVLGTGLERIPWESLPVLRKCAVSRMPSLSFLAMPLQQQVAIDPANAFFILNPSNDLAATQAAFLEPFRQRGWRGIAGAAPTSEQFLEALKAHDLFVYCGHNSGEQYLRRECIERQLDAVRPVALLMGCSSAALRNLGRYEPCGIVQSYLAAHCPAVAGNLFDVTDADIDRFLAAVLDKWLAAPAADASLAQCVADARDTCKLPYLVGSSPVVYGLPNVVVATKPAQ